MFGQPGVSKKTQVLLAAACDTACPGLAVPVSRCSVVASSAVQCSLSCVWGFSGELWTHTTIAKAMCPQCGLRPPRTIPFPVPSFALAGSVGSPSTALIALQCSLWPSEGNGCFRYGADPDASSPKGWTPLSYAKARGKYGPTEEAGIYPEVGSAWRPYTCQGCVPSTQAFSTL